MGREFAKALEAAGVVSDLDTIERIVIDVRWDRVDVHVKRIGTGRLLGVAPLLPPLLADDESDASALRVTAEERDA
jgi:hypothetical protein